MNLLIIFLLPALVFMTDIAYAARMVDSDMMHGNGMMSGWTMILWALLAILFIIALILAILALIKYLRSN